MRSFIIRLLFCLLPMASAFASHDLVKDHQYYTPHVTHAMIPKEDRYKRHAIHWRDQLTLNKKFSHAIKHGGELFRGRDFNQIEAYGDVDLYIRASKHSNGLRYHYEKNMDPLYAKLEGKKLIVCRGLACLHHNQCAKCCQSHFQGQRARVYIDVRDLDYFRFVGQGNIKATKLHSKHLDLDIVNCGKTEITGRDINLHHIHADGNGQIYISSVTTPKLDADIEGGTTTIRGVTNLEDLYFHGHGRLNMFWLNSCNLHVRGRDQGEAMVAGVADRVHVDLAKNAFFNARFLRANLEYVETHDTSRADVWANKVLNALANDFSNIYYYYDSDYIGRYMKEQGSVLRMVGADYFRCHGHPGLYRDHFCPFPPVEKLASVTHR